MAQSHLIGDILLLILAIGLSTLTIRCSVTAVVVAILTTMLVLSAWVEQKLGRNVIVILSKITGLILSAMAAQLVFTGIKHILAI